MIYLDHSATTAVDREVAELAVEVLCRRFGNPSSQHYLGAEAYGLLGVARSQTAKVLGARPRQVFFTSGATESNNLAIGAIRQTAGRHIVTTALEHESVLAPCRRLEQEGYAVMYLRPEPGRGSVTAGAVAAAVGPDTGLVSVQYVNNETGAINPIGEIAAAVRAKNPKTLIHCDCVQGYGKLPFPLHRFDVDLVSASAHKLYGPKGVGLLYARDPSVLRPLSFGGAQEGGIHPGTESTALIAAFGLAADRALYGMARRAEDVARVRRHLERLLRVHFPEVCVHSPADGSPYLLNFSLPGRSSQAMVAHLSRHEIYVSAGSACSRGARSHVLEAMGLPEAQLDSALRVSFGKDTTCADVEALVQCLTAFDRQ